MSPTPTESRNWGALLIIAAVAALVLSLIIKALGAILWAVALIAIVGAALLFFSSNSKQE